MSHCAILLLVLAAWPASAQEAAWKVETPYPNNPLKQALLSGTVQSAGVSSEAQLQLECRPDAEGPRLNLVLTPSTVKFDADPFEGPGGLGERRQLRLSLGSNAWPHHFSGYYIDAKQFVFSFALSPAEASRIVSSPTQTLTVIIDPAKEGAPLQFRFPLPSDSAPVRTVATPCLNHRHKS